MPDASFASGSEGRGNGGVDGAQLAERLRSTLKYAHFKQSHNLPSASLLELEHTFLGPLPVPLSQRRPDREQERAQSKRLRAAQREAERIRRDRTLAELREREDDGVDEDEARRKRWKAGDFGEEANLEFLHGPRASEVKLGKRKAVDPPASLSLFRAVHDPDDEIEDEEEDDEWAIPGAQVERSSVRGGSVGVSSSVRGGTSAGWRTSEALSPVTEFGPRVASVANVAYFPPVGEDEWAASAIESPVQARFDAGGGEAVDRLQSLRKTTSELLEAPGTGEVRRKDSAASLLGSGVGAGALARPFSPSSLSAPASVSYPPDATDTSPFLLSSSRISGTTLAPASSSTSLQPPPAAASVSLTGPALPPLPPPPSAPTSTSTANPSTSTGFVKASSLLSSQPTFSALPAPPPLPFDSLPLPLSDLPLTLPLSQQPPSQPSQSSSAQPASTRVSSLGDDSPFRLSANPPLPPSSQASLTAPSPPHSSALSAPAAAVEMHSLSQTLGTSVGGGRRALAGKGQGRSKEREEKRLGKGKEVELEEDDDDDDDDPPPASFPYSIASTQLASQSQSQSQSQPDPRVRSSSPVLDGEEGDGGGYTQETQDSQLSDRTMMGALDEAF
ncbi:hypothetical protein JCM8097_006969 [Rhodosporidiobolus ruineniae]